MDKILLYQFPPLPSPPLSALTFSSTVTLERNRLLIRERISRVSALHGFYRSRLTRQFHRFSGLSLTHCP